MDEIHIGERIQLLLEAHGFKKDESGIWSARRLFPELSGSITDGHRLVRLRFSANLRWLDVLDGWGHEEKCFDMRDYYGPHEAEHAERLVNGLIGDPA